MYRIGSRTYGIGCRDRYGIGAALQRARTRTVPGTAWGWDCDVCESCGGVCTIDPFSGVRACSGLKGGFSSTACLARVQSRKALKKRRALGRPGGRRRLRVGATTRACPPGTRPIYDARGRFLGCKEMLGEPPGGGLPRPVPPSIPAPLPPWRPRWVGPVRRRTLVPPG
jgi:hypothetical protein